MKLSLDVTTTDFAVIETFYSALWGFVLGVILGIVVRALSSGRPED